MKSLAGRYAALLLSSALLTQAQTPGPDETPAPDHSAYANCTAFGPRREAIAQAGRNASLRSAAGALTVQVARQLPKYDETFVPGGSRTDTLLQIDQLGTIDRNIFGVLRDNAIAPAERTGDYEFIRRVTLDLTGRVPDAARVTTFIADTRSNKRDLLIDELMAKQEWIDKWTMFYGDLFNNNSRNTQVQRYDEGVTAFYQWIQDSLKQNKPYNQMATELIAATGANSWTDGTLNFVIGGTQTGGVPIQDTFDSQAVLISSVFLGISHLNCLLCHNGRGHLDQLSLWGKNSTRQQAWGMASYLSRTAEGRTRTTANVTPYYWDVADTIAADYTLNTTTGNRPARQGSTPNTRVSPAYMFNGHAPAPGTNYRQALAKEITGDIQFARAAVNYIWREFFTRAIVDPPDGFDPARLDPDNPPTDGWSLQPSNAQLLNELAADFVQSNFNIKALMKQICSSQAYQLSSRYNGQWDPNWERLYARKLVRRLWAEELHDSIVQTSGVLPSYNFASYNLGTLNYAMKFPETMGTGGSIAPWLDSFLRGNRDDEDRRSDGSISQALDLMNDPFVMSRVRVVSSPLLAKNIGLPNDQLVNTLYLGILSRVPTDAEKSAAVQMLSAGTNRNNQVEDLAWSLYNKVDFIFNY